MSACSHSRSGCAVGLLPVQVVHYAGQTQKPFSVLTVKKVDFLKQVF